MSDTQTELAAGYAQASALQAQRVATGARVVGRKIGFTNPQLWPVYGVHQPIWGAVYDATLHPVARPSTFSLRGTQRPRIEPEIALRISRTPPALSSLADLAACVDAVAHGFEIVDSPYPDWKFTAAQAVAVGSLHAALLLGPAQAVSAFGPDWAQALASVQLRLLCDGSLREEGVGQAVLGGPLQALAHLVQVLHEQGAPALQPGEWVTTGTLTQAHPIAPGQRWHTELQGPGSGPNPWASSGLDVRLTD